MLFGRLSAKLQDDQRTCLLKSSLSIFMHPLDFGCNATNHPPANMYTVASSQKKYCCDFGFSPINPGVREKYYMIKCLLIVHHCNNRGYITWRTEDRRLWKTCFLWEEKRREEKRREEKRREEKRREEKRREEKRRREERRREERRREEKRREEREEKRREEEKRRGEEGNLHPQDVTSF